jgi:hypothetical protein
MDTGLRRDESTQEHWKQISFTLLGMKKDGDFVQDVERLAVRTKPPTVRSSSMSGQWMP